MSKLKISNYLCMLSVTIIIHFIQLNVFKIYAPHVYEKHHTTIYVDRGFNNNEVEFIKDAAGEWSFETNHIVDFDVIQLPVKNLIYSNSLFILKKYSDDPKIIFMDLKSSNETLGFFENKDFPTIHLVSDRLTQENYKEVILHEMGHSIGLKHLTGLDNAFSLMYPYSYIEFNDNVTIPAGSPYITKKDLIAFCKLYKCNVEELIKH